MSSRRVGYSAASPHTASVARDRVEVAEHILRQSVSRSTLNGVAVMHIQWKVNIIIIHSEK